ncbi:MAG: hypothetical protein QM500_19575 [Methylococcales bacterium]
MSDMPVVQLDTVFHIGKMEGANAHPGYSLEGHGLSISLHPEDWRSIARLGNIPCWELTKPGAEFLDALKFEDTPILMASMISWAVDEKLIVPTTLYKFEWYDDELEQMMHMLFDSYDKALEEAGDEEDVVSGDGWIATPQLLDHTHFSKMEPVMVLSLALLVYAETVLYMDGVYWDEALDPARLSAPRGCIFPGRLDAWSKNKIT